MKIGEKNGKEIIELSKYVYEYFVHLINGDLHS